MNTIFTTAKLDKLTEKCNRADRVAIISHTNPDGDAVGSGLALKLYLRERFPQKNIRFFVPNHFPESLGWVDTGRDVEIFSEMYSEGTAFLAAADLIFIVDFNQPSRLDRMSPALEANIHADRILIDHHIDPPKGYDLEFHSVASSSTAFMVYNLIESWSGVETIDLKIANALYMGIMTDTGCFSFGNLTPELYRAVAVLVERGVKPPEINQAIFNNQSEDRTRLVGYLISNKMVVNLPRKAAYITLTQEEKERFNHQIGDTEGVVNVPLTIKDILFSALLIENNDHVKISLRSIGEMDVNVICREYFNGGGHRNAAGGKFAGSIADAVVLLESVIAKL